MLVQAARLVPQHCVADRGRQRTPRVVRDWLQRVAQLVVKQRDPQMASHVKQRREVLSESRMREIRLFEPELDPIFLVDSYGYRPGKSALDAVGVTRQRCWKYDWVLEFDIKGLFDN